MLEKVVKIKNVGRLRSLSAAGDVAFRDVTLVFGGNGRGNTTLCDVLRSLATGEVDYMQGRQSLGANEDVEVELRWSDGNVRFTNDVWTELKPEIDIFDDTFVHENVYAGPYVDAERLRRWYKSVDEAQSEVEYDFVYVDQESWDKYQPGKVAELVEGYGEYKGS